MTKPLSDQYPKGRAIPAWANPEALAALDKALDGPAGRIRPGTYATEALMWRLRREGHLTDTDASDIASRAYELTREFGAEAVRAKLDELAQSAAAAASAP